MSVRVYGLKIDTQTESCELGFVAVGVTMRTIVQDTASQMPLRSYSEEMGRGQYIWDFSEGEASTQFGRRLLLLRRQRCLR